MSKAKLRAEAIDRFVTDAKAQGVWQDIDAAVVLGAWSNLAGALTPLKGPTPTNNGFAENKYDRGIGVETTTAVANYINSNYPANTNATDDTHASYYLCSKAVAESPNNYANLFGNSSGSNGFFMRFVRTTDSLEGRLYSYNDLPAVSGVGGSTGLVGFSRSDNANATMYVNGQGTLKSSPAAFPFSASIFFGTIGSNGVPIQPYANHNFSFYSLGKAIDLSALDTLVTRLMADLRAIEEDGMDRDALAYIRAVEAADGSFMVTGVKQAVDRLVKGLKFDKDANGRSAWDAIGASCLLCGPRTIAGALVPLRGAAPTAYNFVSANYNQETGLLGVPAATTRIDTNRPNNADGQDDNHISVYATSVGATNTVYLGEAATGRLLLSSTGNLLTQCNGTVYATVSGGNVAGFMGGVRASSTTQIVRAAGATAQNTNTSIAPSANNMMVFSRGTSLYSDARLAFYSIGASLSLSALDSRITKYVADVAAAIP